MSTKRAEGPVQLNLRVSVDLAESLDALVEQMNADGVWPKITRTDVLRKLLEWSIRERPEWLTGTRAPGDQTLYSELDPALAAMARVSSLYVTQDVSSKLSQRIRSGLISNRWRWMNEDAKIDGTTAVLFRWLDDQEWALDQK